MLGPIFPVELVITVRRARYYWLRVVYAVLLLFVLWVSYLETFAGGQATSLQSAARFGENFFNSFGVLQLLSAIVVAAAVTAGTIAEERERRTIEYLFATDLSNAEIVLGKLVSRLLHVLAFLATALPVLSLTLLFGGTDIENLLQISAITLSTVFASASIGICLSIWTTRPRHAVLRAFIVLFALMFLPIFGVTISFIRPGVYAWFAAVNNELLVSNPFLFLMTMSQKRMPPGIPLSPGWYGVFEMVRDHGIVSLVMIALAVWRVRRVHLSMVTRGEKSARGRWRMSLWRPRLGNLPMLWKEMFGEQAIKDLNIVGRVIVGLLFVAILVPLARTFYMCYTGRYPREVFQETATILSGVIGCAFLVVVAARAAGSVTTEREKQSWEVLISTPLTGGEIVLGKGLGNLYALRWLVGIIAVVWAMAGYLLPHCLWLGLLTLLTLALLSPFFTNTGLFFSLLSRNSTRAMLASLLVSVLMCGAYLIVVVVMSDGPLDRGNRRFFLAPCAPWLVSWPGGYDPRLTAQWRHDSPPAVYLVGMSFYLVLGVVSFLVNVCYFDRWSGRVPQAAHGQPPPDRKSINTDEPIGAVGHAAFASVATKP